MRKYYLASKDAKDNVDLREYQQVIEDAVHEVLPLASVQVAADHYIVTPTPKQGDAVKIGRAICKSALKKHCIQIPKLFTSIEIKDEKNDGKTKQQQYGGHHGNHSALPARQ